jgi:biopolymer transport protein ExbB/TolQ
MSFCDPHQHEQDEKTMETALPPLAAGAGFNATISSLIANADPVVKGVMLILVFASVICWAIILEKAIRLIRFGGQVRRLERFVSGTGDAAPDRAGLAGAVLAAARRLGDSAPGESRSEFETRIEKAMRLAARFELSKLQPRLRFLATVGSTAPFVGLFGTVWGIMNSFTAIAGQQDTSLAVVAPGIAEALFATALGLVAAIPAVVAYNQLTGSLARAGERINFAIATLAQSAKTEG